MKDINTFVTSMKDGPKEYVLTDEGDIKNFLELKQKKSLETSLNYHNHS
jgi:hypothetical protein